ncbi:hypothetical protein VitviT2T_009528 [Vitis vinifera]|uniref:RING-type E3 ubiquitin transferase n=2 Tax=Vitis vinifera TaxID=29760 RepID=A0A438KH93_VITVI|nr:RING-H2 finger protein ATL64 [Vitis vinifera]RVW54514.1 RING-H2 finger protein ATL2 [Vitis vinifera]RVX20558.1 RING-H2 finger protein ATL2 [Vitis vinifera]WJZ90381.1 hypothetical protein VitviT2T_009528 [Vitis vinifera]|eukprot:XP_003632375.1 PREDICTED: RING-H2 finger protein ATL64 [Vitis vinifera]
MDDNTSGISKGRAPSSYALSGKVMLSSVVILFTVVAVIVFFHSYARWLLSRDRTRRHLRRRSRIRFDSDRTTAVSAVDGVVDQGLDVSILKSLPTFVYSKATHGPILECAVCLSEFEDDEKGRVLPKCNHCFHNDCIDMWFHSHSNCPLCRALVPLHLPSPPETVVPVLEPAGTETISGASPRCPRDDDENETGPSSSLTPGTLTLLECPRKPLELVGITVEMPAMRAGGCRGLEEVELGTTESQSSKSPGSRILSLKRIWST